MRNVKDTLQYILKRLLLMAFTFLVIFVICFTLIRLLPIDLSTGLGKDPDTMKKFYVSIGRMRYVNGKYEWLPIIEQFFNFIKTLFVPPRDVETGKVLSRFGYSYQIAWGSTPDQLLFSRFPPTILINVYSMILSVPLGLGLGTFMALRKNKWEDNFLSVLIMIFISVPSFVDAFLLQYFLGYQWGIFDPVVLPLADADNSWLSPAMFKSMVLPVIAMSLGSIAGYARYTRAELTEVLTSDFMLLARTKGLTRAQATVRHAFRNSLVPIFPMILGEVLSVLGGSIIIESIFTVNGVGGLLLQAIQTRDVDVYQFVAMFYITIGLVGGLIVDLSYGLVDPRIRMGGGKQ